jgi:hypothetical protein
MAKFIVKRHLFDAFTCGKGLPVDKWHTESSSAISSPGSQIQFLKGASHAGLVATSGRKHHDRR